ncbi:MAG: hypothetical protein RJA61_221 [Candidatus Parcubacteria bacterium]|jgi:leucyl-tRNA synthetase
MKEYDHKKIESKWQKFWAKEKVFSADDKSDAEKKFVLIEFPYPSGTGLHMGHMRPFIAGDVVSKYWKLKGKNVMYPIGWDAFGLPAENFAIKNKVHPSVSTKKNIANAKKQLQSWGTGFDWTREINTTNPEYYRWTQWLFLQFLKKGLAYEATGLINWCPKDKTGLANEEVIDGKCERCGTVVEKKELKQWYLKITDYAEKLLQGLKELPEWPEAVKTQQENWIGKSEGVEFIFRIKDYELGIKVFTTRPDTLFGVTYVVLSPESDLILKLKDKVSNWSEVEKYIEETKNKTEIERTAEGKEKTGVELKGIKVINPANNEEVPVFVADYVLGNYGTGAVMAVPAHDERDFEFAKKYNLPIKEVIEPTYEQTTEPGKIKEGEPFDHREAIIAIVKHWSEEKYMALKWKQVAWGTFITGGIESGQTPEDAGRMEVREETGYLNLRFVKDFGVVHGKFYHVPKKTNRNAHAHMLYFELEDDKRNVVAESEQAIHELLWLTKEELQKFLTPATHQHALRLLGGETIVFTDEGTLVNSGEFDRFESPGAREKITEKFGQKKTTYKLRDWVFSRQRYWGEPIPVIHCEKCGIVSVPEKDLPVLLPKVKNYEPTGTGESPLAAIEKWVRVKCPECGENARRETNTMPQWAGSSWYWLRYADPKNTAEFASQEMQKKWTPVDMYFGGMEHTTLHLLYSRFWNLFLYDQGLVTAKEPYLKRIPHGIILGPDGEKMSKSRGNVVNPDDFVKDFGADTTRMYMMFLGPHGNRVAWNSDGIIGTRRFLEKVWRLKNKIEDKKEKVKDNSFEILLNKTIKKVGEDIESFNFNTAISSLMILANELDKKPEISQGSYEILLKLVTPFAPHITDELWNTLGHTQSIYCEVWPQYDPHKLVSEEISVTVQIGGKVRGRISASRGITEEIVVSRVKEVAELAKWFEGKEIKKVVYIQDKIINFVI